MKPDRVDDPSTTHAGIWLVGIVVVALGGGFLAGWVQRHGVIARQATADRARADLQSADARVAERLEAARDRARALDDAWGWRLRRRHPSLVARALAHAAGVGDAGDPTRPQDDVLRQALAKLRTLTAGLPPVPELAAALDDWIAMERERNNAEGATLIAELSNALDPEPRRQELRALLGTVNAGRLRDLADAVDSKRDPPATIALLVKGLAHAGLADVAIRLGERELLEAPSDFPLQVLIADLLFDRGPPAAADAARHYTAALALRPASVRAWCHFGTLLADQARDTGGAVELMQAATRNHAGVPALIYVRGEVLARARHFSEAQQVFAQVLAIDPRCALAQAGIGDAMLGRDVLDPLVITSSTLLFESGGVTTGGDAKSDERAWRDLLERAKEAYEESLRLFDTPEGRAGLAAVTWTQGDKTGATALLEEAVRRHPEDAMLRDHLGMSLLHRGRDAEALAQFREAVRLDEWNPAVQNDYAWELASSADPKLRRPGQALEHARRACELEPGNSWNRNTLGVALYRIGEWEQAIAEFEASCKLPRGNGPYDHYFLAMANQQLGEPAAARDHYALAESLPIPGDKVLERIREEATEVLGMPRSDR